MDDIMLLHVYLQQNKAVIGYFITSLCNNGIDTTATSVSATREQRVLNMAVPRGSVSRRYLQLYLGVFGFKCPRNHPGSIYKYLVIYIYC